MPYVRDINRATRGAGAIAAADLAEPARQRARVAVGQATRRRDRAMSAITQGALGIVSTSDPLPTRSTPRLTGRANPPQVTNAADLTVQQRRAAIASVLGRMGSRITITPPPELTPPPGPVPTTPPPAALTPTPMPPTPAPRPIAVGPTTTTVVSGGSSAGGGVTTRTGAVLTAPPSTTLPDVPDGQASDGILDHPVLVAAGAALVAYLIFSRRRGT